MQRKTGDRKHFLFGGAAAISQFAAGISVILLIKLQFGVEALGTWSLLMASLSVINISSMGLGQSMVHLTQASIENGSGLKQLLKTVVTITFISAACLALALYIPVVSSVTALSETGTDHNADMTLSFLLVSFVLYLVALVPGYTLNGLGVYWLAQINVAVGNVLFMLFAVLLVSRLALLGAAMGHLAMSITVLVMNWTIMCIVLRRYHGISVGINPFGFSKRSFKRVFSLGLSFQLTSLLMIFLEPLARYTTGIVGGLSAVGYYEIASRVVTGMRELIARPLQFLSGRFAALDHDKDQAAIWSYYSMWLKRLSVVGVLMFTLVTVGFTTLAEVFMGSREPFLVFCAISLAFGWSFAVPALVPWYWGVGSGRNTWNLKSVVVMFLIAASAFAIAVATGQSKLVPLGLMAAIIVGEVYLILTVNWVIRTRV